MSMSIAHAGAKDHPITLQKKTVSSNDYGEHEVSWADDKEMMASRSDRHGDEDTEARQRTATSEVTWRIWYVAGITAGGYRVRDDYTNEIYDILSIRQLGRRQELELKTEAKDSD